VGYVARMGNVEIYGTFQSGNLEAKDHLLRHISAVGSVPAFRGNKVYTTLKILRTD